MLAGALVGGGGEADAEEADCVSVCDPLHHHHHCYHLAPPPLPPPLSSSGTTATTTTTTTTTTATPCPTHNLHTTTTAPLYVAQVVFRSLHRLLADTASSEFLFAVDFWGDESVYRAAIAPSLAALETGLTAALQARTHLHHPLHRAWVWCGVSCTARFECFFIKHPTNVAALSWSTTPHSFWCPHIPPPFPFPPLQSVHDVLTVLLMVRLNAQLRALMAARRLPCLDDYYDRVSLLLWPRAKVRVTS